MAFPPKKRVIQPSWRVVDLSHVHTKVLLKFLDKSRRRYVDDLPVIDNQDVSIDIIRVELGKREHVLNKLEAREARQMAAKRRNRRRKTSGYRRGDHEHEA
jgi:hypothetical protein